MAKMFHLFPSDFLAQHKLLQCASCWSVRRLKASPTPPYGIFNLIISGRRGLGIQIVVLSYCLVVALLLPCCCLVRVSKGEQRQLTDIKCYIFSKSSQQLGVR